MDTLLNIVVVEDHDALREVTVEALRGMGHAVIGLDCAEAVAERLGAEVIHVMIIDVNLPGENGFALGARLRAAQPDMGLIFMTSRAQLVDKLSGYKSGADLYLTKPVLMQELSAAVLALGRRVKPQPQPAYRLDLRTLVLHGPAATTPLTKYQAAQLSAVARAPGNQLENWQLLELSAGSDTGFAKGTLDVQIFRLRKKLAHVGHHKNAIQAIRGWGYRLCLPLFLS